MPNDVHMAPAIFVRPEKAAVMVGLGRTQLFALLARGEIESFRVGRARLIPVDALRAWGERQREEARREP